MRGERLAHARRKRVYSSAVICTSLLAVNGALAFTAEIQGSTRDSETLGFVFTQFAYALSKDASETGACPDGLTSGYSKVQDVYVAGPDAPQIPNPDDEATLEHTLRLVRTPNLQNYCQNPELGKPDPHWHIVTGANVAAKGIDLDGQDSRVKGKSAPNTCAHDDFHGLNGERGIDNQFYRVVGCGKSYQSTGQSNGFGSEMYTGAWGILLTLKGARDLRNAQDIEVGIYANADPMQLSPTREALPNATYAMDQDPRFRAKTRGRIVNGVLTTDPVDMRFHYIVNGIHVERTLQDARVHANVNADGSLEGILGAYSPVDDLYDFQFSFRNGKDDKGNPSPFVLRSVSSIGYAITSEDTCQGAYYALKKYADGHRDAKTGQCSSISTQYEFKAIPAFVVDTATKSVNDVLIHGQ